MTIHLFTERPQPTALAHDAHRFGQASEFDTLDTQVGHLLTDALRHNQHDQETAA